MLFRSSVEKENAKTPLGLQFWMTPYSSILIISVDDHGLFAGRLKAGMHVEKVNDRFVGDCQEQGSITTVAELQEYLTHLSGRITIWASDGRPQRLLQHTSGNEYLAKTRKSQQDSIMMDVPSSVFVGDSDSSCSDYSNVSYYDYDGDDEHCRDGSIMDEGFIDALLHRFTV